jgi:hypothetical protein
MDMGGLSPRERAAHYRALAAAQLELGGRAEAEIASTHFELAAMWTRLAEEAERQHLTLDEEAPQSDARDGSTTA